jgi:hypothetical protein
MSLKAIHVIVILASIVLAFGFGAWSLKGYFDGEPRSYIWYGAGSLLLGLVLIVYLRSVLKKLKDVSYL